MKINRLHGFLHPTALKKTVQDVAGLCGHGVDHDACAGPSVAIHT